MTDIEELGRRVAEATGPDREIDKALAILSRWTTTGKEPPDTGVPDYWYSDAFGMPAYSGSIDAALALVERMLPGWCWKLVSEDGRYIVVLRNAPRLEIVAPASVASSPTAPLAIISALLKALSSIRPNGGAEE